MDIVGVAHFLQFNLIARREENNKRIKEEEECLGCGSSSGSGVDCRGRGRKTEELAV